jgi:TrmH family RNA methyltransferase
LRRAAVRRAEGRFLVEGPQALREAAAAGALLGAYATAGAASDHAEMLAGLPVTIVGDRALASLAETVTPQGLVGVATAITVPAALACAPSTAGPDTVVVLVDVSDPGNAGTVVRVADAAGAGAVVFADGPGGGSVDPHNGKCVRASAGSLFHLPIGLATLDEVLQIARETGRQVLAADSGRAPFVDLEEADELLGRPTCWLFGNEAHGLPEAAVAAADHVLRVPLYGRAESLNLATAAAVCLYAGARRQRARAGGGA